MCTGGSHVGRGKWSQTYRYGRDRHQIVACQQGFEAVVVAFGLRILSSSILPNWLITPSAGITVHSDRYRLGVLRHAADGQRIVKGAVAGGIRLLRLFHVDL